ncbi:MAG: substrate-binding domain-containing protein [Anaerolineae bacterium]|nr:substrate-binding domain-containing protein [Anaerolineae bacterium]
MILTKREAEIVKLVNKEGAVTVRELAAQLNVNEVTIRRDLARLTQLKLLQRRHGSAIRADGILGEAGIADPLEAEYLDTDALILAPVENQAAHMLRERAIRNHIPLLAESIPLEGAVYLGPKNWEAAYDLGRWMGEYLSGRGTTSAFVLDISQPLSNTQMRSEGFAEGLKSVLSANAIRILSVNGQGLYNEAYLVAFNALQVHPDINVIFGINDDSVLAGIQAYLDLDRDAQKLAAVNVGGEGKTLFDMLHAGGPLKACAALFPEYVGQMAIEATVRLWAKEDIGESILTPSTILTIANLSDYYRQEDGEWKPALDMIATLAHTAWQTPLPIPDKRRIEFVILYPTHEWYQNLARAMHNAAEQLSLTVSVKDVTEDVKSEISELRRQVGKSAASYVDDNEIIIVDAGTATVNMAQFLNERKNLTVITNSLLVFQRLQRSPNIRVILTGGEPYPESQALVGRSAELVLREFRAHKVFISASGISAAFGISCRNQPEAEIRRAMLEAARQVVVLVDHTALGADSHVKIADLDRAHTIITDTGASSSHLLDLQQRGIKVVIAGQIAFDNEASLVEFQR